MRTHSIREQVPTAPERRSGTMTQMGKSALEDNGLNDGGGEFRVDGSWLLHGDEAWIDDPFRRRAAQESALS